MSRLRSFFKTHGKHVQTSGGYRYQYAVNIKFSYSNIKNLKIDDWFAAVQELNKLLSGYFKGMICVYIAYSYFCTKSKSMKFKLLPLLSLIFVLFATVSSQSQPRKGAPMPDFKFYKLNSAPFTRNDVPAGKKSIIILFDSTCDHCQQEIKDIGSRYSDFKNTNFYLVSFDVKPQIDKFMSTFGKVLNGKPNVVVLRDVGYDFVPKFQPTKFPAMYIFSEKKQLIEYIAGQKDVAYILAALKK
jgi:hypothetical protein